MIELHHVSFKAIVHPKIKILIIQPLMSPKTCLERHEGVNDGRISISE